jgi:hypothetical protein
MLLHYRRRVGLVTDSNGDLVHHHIRDVGRYALIGEIALVHKNGRRTAHVVAKTYVKTIEIPHIVFLELMGDNSFRLFIDFLSTDRLMEDGARDRQKHPLLKFLTFTK